MLQLKPSDAIPFIKAAYIERQPVFLWGAPGIGKSDLMRQVAEDLGISLIDIRVSQLDQVDMRGVPSVEEGYTTWNPPEFLPTAGAGIVFCDELNSGHPSVLATMYQFLLDFRVGKAELPDSWCPMAAGNREQDGGVTYQLPTPVALRLMHVELIVDLDDWMQWALANGIRTEILAYHRWMQDPKRLCDFQRKSHSSPNPRGWSKLSKVMNSMPERLVLTAASGLIGDGEATDFAAFLRTVKDLPSWDEILRDPDHCTLPKDVGARYAVSALIGNKMTPKVSDKAFRYLERLPAEFHVRAVQDARARDAAICKTPAFVAWCRKHQDVLL